MILVFLFYLGYFAVLSPLHHCVVTPQFNAVTPQGALHKPGLNILVVKVYLV